MKLWQTCFIGKFLLKTTCITQVVFCFITKLTWDINPKTYHPNGGVRGGTIRLLPVDSKAEAKRSRLLSS